MDDYKNLLNEQQQKPAEDTEGAVLVFAGAGSGKTRVLTYRIARLVKEFHVPPRNILAITFTNKSANEMRERIAAVAGANSDMWVCTIHSMCTRILRTFADRIGYDRNFSIYTTTDKDRVLKRIMDEMKVDDESVKKNIAWNISDAKASDLSPSEYADKNRYNHKIKTVTEIFLQYERELMKCNALDFDDLLIKTHMLLKTSAEAAEYYQEKFRYIHVDEFQDTNRVQLNILKILSAKYGNIFAVGDDDQSIYGWRGAELKNILDFGRSFPGAKIYKLEQNYRSTKKILEAANKIISLNTNRYAKKLFTENGEGAKIEGFTAFDEVEESAFAVNAINSLVRSEGYRYGDFAVLMRVNALSRTYEQELRKYNIPYTVFGGFKFFERKEVKDLIAYLRLLQNPADDEALLRVVNVPKRGIGDAAILLLKTEAAARRTNLFNVVSDIENANIPDRIKSKIIPFRDILNALLALKEDLPVDALVKKLIELTDYRAQFNENTEEDISRALNVDEFLQSVKEFADMNPGADLPDYLTSVSLSSDLDEAGEAASDFVSLATVHAAKGLEFKCVFIVGLDENIFPVSRGMSDDKEMEEERRLMYVAVTRARERLYLTRAKSRFMYGERNFTVPSRFYNDLFPPPARGFPQPSVPRPPLYGTYAAPRPSVYTTTPPAAAPPPPMGGGAAAGKAKTDYGEFFPNVKVVHKVFGEGVIISTRGEGETKAADVLFKGIGVKTLSLMFAPLQIIKGEA